MAIHTYLMIPVTCNCMTFQQNEMNIIGTVVGL